MNTACVFKLHGTVSGDMLDCSTLVLPQRQYDQHYADNGEVREALKAFAEKRSLLFLGCSLGTDRTVDVLREAAGEGVIHYAMVECGAGDSDECFMELADELIGELAYAYFMPQGHTDEVNAVCFSPDGAPIASGSTDGTVRLWDALMSSKTDNGSQGLSVGTIKSLFSIDITGLDLSLAIIEDEHDREVLYQNGVKVSGMGETDERI